MLTAADFLREIRLRGATRISHVRFRENRSTVWSLTQNGTVLNVHAAYSRAPGALLDAFAVVAREGGVHSRLARRAAEEISAWPELGEAIGRIRTAHAQRMRSQNEAPGTHCCATSDQRRHLRALYRYLNETRFGGLLPTDVPVRLSGRMRSALGHMLPGDEPEGSRHVIEIALNCDLMLAGNGAERVDTLLHEMAHAADYLESGHRGHGPSWKAWAVRAGCRPTTLYDRPIRHRRRRSDPVTRVPPLPVPIRRLILDP